MTTPPPNPKIYHITHVDNLERMVAAGGLISDAEVLRRGGPAQVIGMSSIKRRRIEKLEVSCHPGTKVGDYVPFYFCPRSIMLYVIYRANHPDLEYRGGQDPIVHLEADLHAVIDWAEHNGQRWAFSLSNAGARYTEFRSRTDDLNQLDWPSIAALDFSPANVKETKQAEFLIHHSLPFDLIERIGVKSRVIEARVEAAIPLTNRPNISLLPAWYY